MSRCDAKIRPFPDATELVCESPADHGTRHESVLRDYAYAGSETTVSWDEDDRRTFHGDWPGQCSNTGQCILPRGHTGNHAQ